MWFQGPRVQVPSLALRFYGRGIVTTLQTLILGIIQGLTEFLPVSSSGHLILGQHLSGLEDLDQYIVFDLVCHMGTLCAIFLVYAAQIKDLIQHNNRQLKQIIIGTLPLFPILLILKEVESFYAQVQYLGLFFLITAGLLFAGIRWGREKSPELLQKKWWQDALIIGCFQTLALLPGISRSGSTISGARLLGWERQSAVTFSFLLVIPAILGGTTLKIAQLYFLDPSQQQHLSVLQYATGFFSSFFVGTIALSCLIRLAAKDKFMYFVWYCLFLGLATSLYFFAKQ